MNSNPVKFFIAICVIVFAGLTNATENYNEALARWSEVLAEFVDEEGRTDFQRLAANRSDLDAYVDYVSRVSPDTDPDQFRTRSDVLAYYINTYNALAMHAVIERGIPDGFTSFFKRVAFFKFHKIIIGSEETSLYDFENKVIRPLNEPRVHFALNCMVKDCPRLPMEPFRAEILDIQLLAVTREFFSKDKHIRLDHDKKTVFVSTILDLYTRDFVASGKANDLIPYVNQYAATPVPDDYKVKYIDYDWRINQQPGK